MLSIMALAVYFTASRGKQKGSTDKLAHSNPRSQNRRTLLGHTTFRRMVPLNLWSQIRQEYPLNLSISISGGKETNKDSPSNGE